jgi:hypothetical protein
MLDLIRTSASSFLNQNKDVYVNCLSNLIAPGFGQARACGSGAESGDRMFVGGFQAYLAADAHQPSDMTD